MRRQQLFACVSHCHECLNGKSDANERCSDHLKPRPGSSIRSAGVSRIAIGENRGLNEHRLLSHWEVSISGVSLSLLSTRYSLSSK